METKKGTREMNANELADLLEKDGEGCTCAAYCAGECACDANWAEYHTKKAATMLRQQQAEIEELQKFLDETCQTGKFIIWNSIKNKAQGK